MIKLILLPLLLLTGCATMTQPPVDKQCSQLATYARSVAVMKDAGVTILDINSFTSQPVVLTFPLQRLKVEVYNREFKTPAETYSYFYNMCTTTGYDTMLDQLKQVDQAYSGEMLKMSGELTIAPRGKAK